MAKCAAVSGIILIVAFLHTKASQACSDLASHASGLPARMLSVNLLVEGQKNLDAPKVHFRVYSLACSEYKRSSRSGSSSST